MNATSKKKPLGVIQEFFGMPLIELREELQWLSVEERLDLAKGAALEMGLKAEEVTFSLD